MLRVFESGLKLVLRSGHCIKAPFGRLTFREIYVTDYLCSSVKLFQSLFMSCCFYVVAIGTGFDGSTNACTNVQHTAFVIIAILPYWIRFLQVCGSLFFVCFCSAGSLLT